MMKSVLTAIGLLLGSSLIPLQAQEASAGAEPVRFLVLASKESPLSSVVAGRVAKVNVQLGDNVAAGKVLAQLDCRDLNARRSAAQAEYHAAQLRYEAKARLQGLNSAAQLEVGLAAAEVNRTKGQMGIFDAQLEQCRFVAPFSGTVARIYVKEGQGVAAGGPVIDIVGSGTLRARLNVPSNWVTWLAIGSQLEATVGETGKTYPLRVTHMSGKVDAVSQTIEIEASFPDKTENVLPGMSGMAVPLSAGAS
ncbi:efflux RND transporter periplasmic adaptor subunit [Enterobacter hormaechei]|uniref:efflux RND transporter periplasmic adaptor subunit n=1 Tax=Enterobacter hormaechei TaxID=158836 RepID=UPI000D390AF4|nr:efflux RND transporter periplasmic adaptor subunit [Enterobacter hormaechei]MDO2398888.1 efflux RND transporter periplasmic adaptor subunit [Enterobacter hormaechei]MDO2404109.1 efflux RND transporter periplasmic adaptor subunit [Enterobacter hormaechei]MDO2418624.1 efflux RND transporter periplasmic adaptor subunit [Enterobacter hormaechei]MDO2426250.1 efflux RND transporter periplasmic adaptor subunit [Enterobacter hormaechei]